MGDTGDLYDAIETGNLEELKRLVEKEGCNVNECYEDQTSALAFAVDYGTPEIVVYLLNHGADPLIPNDNMEFCFDEEPIRKLIVKKMLKEYNKLIAEEVEDHKED